MWVGLRTLRQRPRLVGQTAGGEPVYEVRSVRMVLRPDANHFNRLAACAKCGASVAGGPLLAPADLDHPSNPVFCKDCVRRSTPAPAPPEPWVARLPAPDRDQPATEPPPPEAATADPPVETAGSVEPEHAGDDRLDALDGRREELAAPAPAATEEELRGRVASVIELVDAQAQVLANVSGTVADQGTKFSEVAEWSRQVTRAYRELTTRVVELAQRVDTRGGAGPRLDDLDRRVDELHASTSMVQERADAGLVAASDRLDAGLAAVTTRLDDLGAAGDDLEARLEALHRRSIEAESRLAAVTAAAEAENGRVHALEEKVQASLRRMTRLVGAQGRHRPAAPVDVRPPAPAPPSTAMLDDLDRQLREAESRLARRSSGGDRPPKPTDQ